MSLISEYTLARDPDFQKRVAAAIARVVTQVVGEPAATANRDERHALGVSVLQPGGLARWTPIFAHLCAANPTIASAGAAALDNDIEFTVTSVWSDVAGVQAA